MSIRKIKQTKEDKQTYNDLSIIIPAAGIGKRMKSYGPKSLITIHNEQRLIDYQLNMIYDLFPGAETILVCGYHADKLMSYVPPNIITVENERYDVTNVARSIGMGLRASTKNNVLIIYGDLVFHSSLLRDIDTKKSWLITTDFMNDREVGCLVNKRGNIINMMYDLPIKWGQIGFFNAKELMELKKLCFDRANGYKFLFEIINKIIDRGGKFKAKHNNKSQMIDIDQSTDLKTAAEIVG